LSFSTPDADAAEWVGEQLILFLTAHVDVEQVLSRGNGVLEARLTDESGGGRAQILIRASGPPRRYSQAEWDHPGALLAEILTDQRWSVDELAERVGLDVAYVQRLLMGEATLTPAVAITLQIVTEVSARRWLELDDRLRTSKSR